MKLIVYNNTTKYKTLSIERLLDDCKHLMMPYLDKNIVSVEITDDYLTIMGENTQIAKINTNNNLMVSGVIRWFDESSGNGMIRLASGHSFRFYSCNVDGANQYHPEMVTNIKFNNGDGVNCEIPADPDIFASLGFINIKKAVIND